jgi:hypothetical protein
VPFGYLDYRIVVLPLVKSMSPSPVSPPIEGGESSLAPGGRGLGRGGFYSIIREAEASKKGFIHLSKWLHKAQKIWEEKRGEKAEKMDIYQRLDRIRGITGQKTSAKYKIIYPRSATYLCSSVIENQNIVQLINGQEINLQEFIADFTCYYAETNNKKEAYYICSILNSLTVDNIIKPMQSRGLFGPRDITKKVWELPIPEFDPSNEDHKALAKLGEECTKKVSRLLSHGIPKKSIGNLRKMIKAELVEEIKEIDVIVRKILKI